MCLSTPKAPEALPPPPPLAPLAPPKPMSLADAAVNRKQGGLDQLRISKSTGLSGTGA